VVRDAAALAQVPRTRGARCGRRPEPLRCPVAGLFIAILAGKLSGEAENFVRVLAQNKRLPLLPEIHRQFEALKNEREGVVEAEVQSRSSSPKRSSPISSNAGEETGARSRAGLGRPAS